MSSSVLKEDGPLSLSRARQLIASAGLDGFLQVLEARAMRAGHNAVIACDFKGAAGEGTLSGIPIGECCPCRPCATPSA